MEFLIRISNNSELKKNVQNMNTMLEGRGAKQGGVGGVSTPPEFWKGGLDTCQPPLILKKNF